MQKITKVAVFLIILTVVASCSQLKMHPEEPLKGSYTFTGIYKSESVKYNSGSKIKQKYEGDIKLLYANGEIFVSGKEQAVNNPKDKFKFTGKGTYDEKAQSIIFTFLVDEREQYQAEYKKTVNGFEFINDDKFISPQISDIWTKVK